MKPTSNAAFIIIDMERGFSEAGSPHCIPMAAPTIPDCSRAINAARERGIPVFFVNRAYRSDGSDVEACRYTGWSKGGKPMAPRSTGSFSCEMPAGLEPKNGDYIIWKPRFSAFFATELDMILRRLRVDTIILTGTTTPNCIRSTCYDGLSLDYNVAIIPECTSSVTQKVQDANLEDMERIGACILPIEEFIGTGAETIPDTVNIVRDAVAADTSAPEII